MKLCRYGAPDEEKPGIVDGQGTLHDLSAVLDDIEADRLDPDKLKALAAAINVETLPVVPGQVRLGVPFTGTPKYIGIGLNYSDHAIEANLPIPDEPVIFNKATSSICGPYE